MTIQLFSKNAVFLRKHHTISYLTSEMSMLVLLSRYASFISVDQSDSIQTTTAVTALVASAEAHRLQGSAPCRQGTDDVDAAVSGFAASPTHQHTFPTVDRRAETRRPENTH